MKRPVVFAAGTQLELGLGISQTGRRDSYLNPVFRFATAIVAPFNEFALGAAFRTAITPFLRYNPLLLYGGVGLGKTHILHAIGHELTARHPKLRILLVSAETFVNEFISSIRFERMPDFRERYRSIDVLLVDGIESLSGKEKTILEFLSVIRSLMEGYGGPKQVILTCDRNPNEIAGLGEDLRSRLMGGLPVRIEEPSLDDKRFLAANLLALRGYRGPVDAEMLDFTARTFEHVRGLVGGVNALVARSEMTGHPISLELAQMAFVAYVGSKKEMVPPEKVLRELASHFGIELHELKRGERLNKPARAKAFWVLKNVLGLSYPGTAKYFIGQDGKSSMNQSSVRTSVLKTEEKMKSDEPLARELQMLAARYGQRTTVEPAPRLDSVASRQRKLQLARDQSGPQQLGAVLRRMDMGA